MAIQKVAIGVEERDGIARQSWPCTRGVPLLAGAVKVVEELWLEDAAGLAAAAQFPLLSRWPDGSVKWVLVDFQVTVAAGEKVRYQLCWGGEKGAADNLPTLSVEEDDERITVCTGPLRFAVSRRRFGLFETVELGSIDENGAFECARQVVPADMEEESLSLRPGNSDAWVRICESFFDGDSSRRTYGMGGDYLASLARDIYRAKVEEAGPLRAVIRCEGAFEAAVPMHHYRGYQPLKFTLRIYAYAGQYFVRVLHTVTVACNPRETEVEEIAVRVGARLQGPLRCRIGLRSEEERALAGGETLLLSQRLDNHFRLERFDGLHKRALAEGERAEGWMTVEDEGAGVGVALRHMAAEYPKALAADGDGGGIDVYLWRDPDGGRLDFKRYAEEVAWDEGEGVYSDGTGSASTRPRAAPLCPIVCGGCCTGRTWRCSRRGWRSAR